MLRNAVERQRRGARNWLPKIEIYDRNINKRGFTMASCITNKSQSSLPKWNISNKRLATISRRSRN